MGLFGDKVPEELGHLLGTMQMSSLDDIDAIVQGSPPPPEKYCEDICLNARIDRAAALARKMASRGKRAQAEALLAEWRQRPVPRRVFFRGAGDAQSFERAAAEAAEQLENLPPDPDQDKKDGQWRAVIDEIGSRADI
jgi:hypothetical protein